VHLTKILTNTYVYSSSYMRNNTTVVCLERVLLKWFIWSEVSWFSWHRKGCSCVFAPALNHYNHLLCTAVHMNASLYSRC